jgi:histidyl-tRNA synthetase
MYSILSSDLQDFYNGCHLVCVPKGSFTHSLKVFLSSILLNPKVHYTLTKQFPHFEVSGEMTQDSIKILQKWTALTNSIKVIIEHDTHEFHNKVKELAKFHKTVDEYSEFVLKPMKLLKASKCLKSAQETISTVFKQVNEFRKVIAHFFCECELKKISKNLEIVKGLKEYTGENIVHSLF